MTRNWQDWSDSGDGMSEAEVINAFGSMAEASKKVPAGYKLEKRADGKIYVVPSDTPEKGSTPDSLTETALATPQGTSYQNRPDSFRFMTPSEWRRMTRLTTNASKAGKDRVYEAIKSLMKAALKRASGEGAMK